VTFKIRFEVKKESRVLKIKFEYWKSSRDPLNIISLFTITWPSGFRFDIEKESRDF